MALFALAMQLVITFGHVHFFGFALASAKSAPIAVADRSSASMPGSADPSRKSNGSADYDCPICALIQMAGTSAPSVAPALLIPSMIGGFRLDVPDEPQAALSPYLSFQARGPPSL